MGSRFQVSVSPPDLITRPTMVSMGPEGMCSPGIHFGNTSVTGPPLTLSDSSVCTRLRVMSRASTRNVRSAALAANGKKPAASSNAQMFAVLIFSSLVGASGAKVGDVPPNGRARQRSDNVPASRGSILNRPFLVAAVLGFLAGIAGSSARAEVPAPRAEDYAAGTLKINVDATDVAHRIFSVHESIPAAPGPLTLLYPQWIPGTHGPSGPIDRLAGLTIRANNQ